MLRWLLSLIKILVTSMHFNRKFITSFTASFLLNCAVNALLQDVLIEQDEQLRQQEVTESPGGYVFDEDDSETCIENFIAEENKYLTGEAGYIAD